MASEMESCVGHKKIPYPSTLNLLSGSNKNQNFKLLIYYWFAIMTLIHHVFITAITLDIPMVGIYPFINPQMNVNGVQSYALDSSPIAAIVKLKFFPNCPEPNLFQVIYFS